MKKKKLNLRTWMFFQIIRPVLLVTIYWLNVQTSSHPIAIVITFAAIGLLAALIYFDKRHELIDELAKANLQRTDAICLKVIFIVSGLIIFSNMLLVFPRGEPYLSWTAIGYAILFLMFILFVLRALIFSKIDRGY